MKAMIAFGLVASLFAAGSAYAETRGQFCTRWGKVCVQSKSGTAESCKERQTACRTSGCFPFKAFGTRCDTDKLTCSQIHKACVGLGVNPDCDSAKARCLKTGRWIGKGGIDYGPALKQ